MSLSVRALEQTEVDRLRHRLVSSVVRMQVVARLERCQELLRIIRITWCFVEVDDGIVRLARSDPFVDRLALCFAYFGVISRAPKRSQSRSVDRKPPRMGACDQLFV